MDDDAGIDARAVARSVASGLHGGVMVQDGKSRLMWMGRVTALSLSRWIVSLSLTSDDLSRCPARGPGPLEIVAAQPAGDIHHLADEIQAGYPFRFQGFR